LQVGGAVAIQLTVHLLIIFLARSAATWTQINTSSSTGRAPLNYTLSDAISSWRHFLVHPQGLLAAKRPFVRRPPKRVSLAEVQLFALQLQVSRLALPVWIDIFIFLPGALFAGCR